MRRMWIIIVLLEYKGEGDRTDNEGLVCVRPETLLCVRSFCSKYNASAVNYLLIFLYTLT